MYTDNDACGGAVLPCRDRLLLQWHITDRCNLRCSHCYQEQYSGEEMSLDGLLEVIQQYKELLDAWRCRASRARALGHVTVTGGEPFLRRDFFELLEVLAANRNHFSFAILTNGCFIDATVARRLRRLGPNFVQVSLDGTRKTHDRIRGQGSFDHAVEGIQQLKRQRIPTSIAFSAHRENYREFLDVCRLAWQLRVDRVWADRLIPSGNGKAMRDRLLDPAETHEFFLLMRQASVEAAQRWRKRTQVSMRRALQFLVGGNRPYHCTAGESLLAVQPNGDVYPCRRLPIRIGNIRERRLIELYTSSQVLRDLRDRSQVSRGCETCLFAQRCGGGLKCLSFAMTGDPFVADPGCWLASIPDDRSSRSTPPFFSPHRISC